MNRRLSQSIILSFLLFALANAHRASAQSPALENGNLQYSLADTMGASHSERDWERSKAAVFLFIATECPISNRYAPEIHRIAAAYEKKGVSFFGVQSDPDLDPAVARKHAAEYGYRFPVLLDPEQKLASHFGVALTPTAVVISPQGRVLYRGRIDNRYLDFGRYRDAGIKADLRLALDAVLAGNPILEPMTKSIGCGLPPLKKISAPHSHH